MRLLLAPPARRCLQEEEGKGRQACGLFFLSGRKTHSDWYSVSGRRAPGQDGERAPGADGERPGRRRRLWRTAPILRPTNLRLYSVYLHAVAVQCNEACHLIRIVVVSGCWWAWMTLRRIEPLRVAKELFRERGPHVAQRLSLSRHHRIACETLRSSKIMLVFETSSKSFALRVSSFGSLLGPSRGAPGGMLQASGALLKLSDLERARRSRLVVLLLSGREEDPL